MRKATPIKPKACALYFCNRNLCKVFYVCPNCFKTTDRLLERSLLYCHTCGQHWDRRVVTMLTGDNRTLLEKCQDFDFERRVLRVLDRFNKRLTTGDIAQSASMTIDRFYDVFEEEDDA